MGDCAFRAFRRGDSDQDGAVRLTDAVATLDALFRGGPASPCPDAAEADDDGSLRIGDAVYTLNYLFLGGPGLPGPGPVSCGADPTQDALSCGEGEAC